MLVEWQKCDEGFAANILLCTNIINKHSPLAYSIVNEIHWYNISKHAGIETVLQCTLSTAYIIEGREIVRKVTDADY